MGGFRAAPLDAVGRDPIAFSSGVDTGSRENGDADPVLTRQNIAVGVVAEHLCAEIWIDYGDACRTRRVECTVTVIPGLRHDD
jgi:hypothetical protein